MQSSRVKGVKDLSIYPVKIERDICSRQDEEGPAPLEILMAGPDLPHGTFRSARAWFPRASKNFAKIWSKITKFYAKIGKYQGLRTLYREF